MTEELNTNNLTPDTTQEAPVEAAKPASWYSDEYKEVIENKGYI